MVRIRTYKQQNEFENTSEEPRDQNGVDQKDTVIWIAVPKKYKTQIETHTYSAMIRRLISMLDPSFKDIELEIIQS